MKTILYSVLLHSLWQGALLALLAGGVLLFARRISPALRYRLLTGLLLLFAAGIAATALYEALSGRTYAAGTAGSILDGNLLPLATAGGVYTTGLVRYLSTYANLVVGIWVLIVCFKSLQLAAGLRLTYHIKTRQVYAAGAHWQHRVNALANRLRIRRPVRILQSALAKAPLVIGHLKPLILMPVGLISQLPAAEVEAILCHELAHIRRKDFLVNLLQAILEVFFFFHPAVLWINRLIREEREHCCDDLALEAGTDVREYVQAMVSIQKRVSYGSPYALSFAGASNHLLHRVTRLLKPGSKRNRKSLQIALILLLSLGTAFLFSGNKDKHQQVTVSKTRVQNNESIVETEQVIKQRLALGKESSVPAEPFTVQEGQRMRDALAGDGLIPSGKENSVFYLLNEEELIVDNARQPEEIHRKYKSGYLKTPVRSVQYSYLYTGRP
jgi:beta-lactamase regulating signal transducer with metallopeptidase domain